VLVFLARTILEKGIKGIQIREEEVILFLFADYMVLYIKAIKDSTRKF
jgi:activator of HSP90 ATPase